MRTYHRWCWCRHQRARLPHTLVDMLTAIHALQVLQTFQKARELGLTVLRMWAFADGPYEWNALQPELELLDDRVLRRARS